MSKIMEAKMGKKRFLMFYLIGVQVLVCQNTTRPRLEAGKNYGRGIQLPGADLKGIKVPKIVSQQANLKGADIRGAQFDNAVLSQANLEGADVSDASFYGAQFSVLRGQSISTSPGANLT